MTEWVASEDEDGRRRDMARCRGRSPGYPPRTAAAGDSRPTKFNMGHWSHRHRGIPPYRGGGGARRDPELLRPNLAVVGCGAMGDDGDIRVCLHPELAWMLPDYTNRWPKAAQLAAISKRIAPLLQGPALRFADARLAPRPAKATVRGTSSALRPQRGAMAP